MENKFIHLELDEFKKVNQKLKKDETVTLTKKQNEILRESKKNSRLDKCYYCGEQVSSFCNSHTLPAFCLRNIAESGKILYANSILDLPTLNKVKGVNEAGTFRLICRDCDSKIFQEYENPANYVNTPTIKMLAQIDMKSNLKNISKRLLEIELYKLFIQRYAITNDFYDIKSSVSKLDLEEFKEAFSFAKKSDKKIKDSDYYLGYYKELPYVVPLAFQGTIALICDLKLEVINNIYVMDPKYKIKHINICIFPLQDKSIIMIFVDKNNSRYRQFFRQLKKYELHEQLEIINYIIFSYSEEFFLSPQVKKETLEKLLQLFKKNQDLLGTDCTTTLEQIKEITKKFNYIERNITPNLLSQEFAVIKQNDLKK